jgi:6-pyruvoyl-tetrahydropterin synthase
MAVTHRTLCYRFRSVHQLDSGPQREQRHGHEYRLEVTSELTSTETLDRGVKSLILPALDKKDLTGVISPATGEVIVEWIESKLRELPGLVAVAVQETRKNRFISSGSDRRYV